MTGNKFSALEKWGLMSLGSCFFSKMVVVFFLCLGFDLLRFFCKFVLSLFNLGFVFLILGVEFSRSIRDQQLSYLHSNQLKAHVNHGNRGFFQ